MNQPIPNEVVQPILDLLEAAAYILIGWVAKWLQKAKDRKLLNKLKDEK